MEDGAVRVLEDGGEDGPQQEGARPPEGRVDAAGVAHVKVQEFHSVGKITASLALSFRQSC